MKTLTTLLVTASVALSTPVIADQITFIQA
mgnify:FL=1